MSNKLKRWTAVFVIASIALCLTAWVVLTFVLIRPPSYAPTVDVGSIALRSWPEHDAIYAEASFPYLVEIEPAAGSLLYFGCRHTSNAADPQLTELEKRWNDFRPTVALCEGRERMNRFASRPISGTYSESQLVRTLAYRSGVKLFTLEPEYKEEVAGLLKIHDAKDVATYFILRVYSSEVKNYKGSRDELAFSLLRQRVNVEGLRNTFDSLNSFDSHWKLRFSDTLDWRDLPNTESQPKLLDIGNTSRQVRGEHMIKTLAELTRKGERVFAVVGASHVIRQEPCLRSLLTTDIK